MIYFAVWILLCFLAAKLADDRGQSGWFAFVLSLFLSPLIGILMVFLRENRVKAPQSASVGARTFTPADYDRVPKTRRIPVEVARGGEALGKLSVGEIERRVRDGELDPVDDHYFDEATGEWLPLGVLVDA